MRHERSAPVLMPELPDLNSVGEVADELPTPAETMERCLGRLSSEQQQYLQFAHINGRSHQEISQLTNNPLGTVTSWIRRALVSLRECLES